MAITFQQHRKRFDKKAKIIFKNDQLRSLITLFGHCITACDRQVMFIVSCSVQINKIISIAFAEHLVIQPVAFYCCHHVLFFCYRKFQPNHLFLIVYSHIKPFINVYQKPVSIMVGITTEPVCLNCGETVGQGRKDKKYCSPECRTDYNNKLNREKQKAKKQEEPSLPTFIGDIQQILI